jgi:hypothetical protein
VLKNLQKWWKPISITIIKRYQLLFLLSSVSTELFLFQEFPF